MLLVPTELRKSPIHGIGLFARERIAKGTVVWKFVEGFDAEFIAEQLAQLPKVAQDYLHFYAYISSATGNYILPSDNGRFFNHSDTPNVIRSNIPDGRDGADIAAQDIEAGEELLYNYNEFEEGLDFRDHS